MKSREKEKMKKPQVTRTNKGRKLLLSKICNLDSKKTLGLKKLLSKVPVGEILQINEIINFFMLAGDKYMPGMHLRQLAYTYSPRFILDDFLKTKKECKN